MHRNTNLLNIFVWVNSVFDDSMEKELLKTLRWIRDKNLTSMCEPSAEIGIGRKLDVEITFDLASFLTKLLPTRFLQLQIRIPHSDLLTGREFSNWRWITNLNTEYIADKRGRKGRKGAMELVYFFCCLYITHYLVDRRFMFISIVFDPLPTLF